MNNELVGIFLRKISDKRLLLIINDRFITMFIIDPIIAFDYQSCHLFHLLTN